MVKCPECAAVLDVDEDDVDEGEIIPCPECEIDLEVVGLHPVQLNVISGEEETEEEEEEEEEESDEKELDKDEVEDEEDEDESKDR